MCLLVYHCLYDIVPAYLTDYLHLASTFTFSCAVTLLIPSQFVLIVKVNIVYKVLNIFKVKDLHCQESYFIVE